MNNQLLHFDDFRRNIPVLPGCFRKIISIIGDQVRLGHGVFLPFTMLLPWFTMVYSDLSWFYHSFPMVLPCENPQNGGLKDLVTKEKANFQAAVEEGEGSQTSISMVMSNHNCLVNDDE